MIFVVAGSKHQFDTFCKLNELSPRSRDVKYVADQFVPRGYRDIKVVFTGTWYDRKDYDVIYHFLKYSGYTDVSEEYIIT
jgi:hypothetical protein